MNATQRANREKIYPRATGQSRRHKWCGTMPVDQCQRCGRLFSYSGIDACGPVYCHATEAWLGAHPEDAGDTR